MTVPINSNYLKTNSSNRILPLFPEIEDLFNAHKKQIENNRKSFGKTYNDKYLDYIFVNEMGDLLLPDYVSNVFSKILKRNNLKHIRFHDLRHSCASLLASNGVPMKNIQEWLGHANFNTTADVYSHLDFTSKWESANVITKMLSGETEEKSIEEEIEELQRLLDEKKTLLNKSNSEM